MSRSDNLDALLGPELVAAIEQLVDERVARAVAELRAPAPVPAWLTVAQAADLLWGVQRTRCACGSNVDGWRPVDKAAGCTWRAAQLSS